MRHGVRLMLNYETAFINGKSSSDFGVYLINGNIFDFPRRDVEYVNVPGRSGSLTLDNGRWESIDITYVFGAYGKNALAGLNAWKNYILSNFGDQEIETSLEPGLYRKGVYKEATQPQVSMLGGGGVVEITFTCMPQKFLKSGDVGTDISDEDPNNPNFCLLKLRNPTSYDAFPIFKFEQPLDWSKPVRIIVYNYAEYIMTNSTSKYVVNALLDTTTIDYTPFAQSVYITIDCETMHAYGSGVSPMPDVDYTEGILVYGDRERPALKGSPDNKKVLIDNQWRTLLGSYSLIRTDCPVGYVNVAPRWWNL